MKRKYISRLLCLLLITGVIFLTGCQLPIKNISGDQENTLGQEQSLDEIGLDNENSQSTDSSGEKGNSQETDKTKLSVTLYYQDAEGYVIPATRRVVKQEGIARAAINGLIDNSANREEIEYFGLYPVLPKDTKILGITIREGTATVDFSKQLLNYKDERAERNIIASIVYTLTEFKTIQNVTILINGYAQEALKFGSDISMPLSRENVLINYNRVNLKQGMKKFDLYYFKIFDDKFSYILPVSVESSNVNAENLPSKIIALLSAGHSNESFSTQFPPDVKLLNGSMKNGVLTLNLNSEFGNYGGHAREDGIIKQILYSMKQIKGVTAVKILLDGKGEYLPEGTDITEAIKVPGVINDYIDKQD